MYPTIKIFVRGGVVCEVDNLPDGFEYEVIDHDIEEIEESEVENENKCD